MSRKVTYFTYHLLLLLGFPTAFILFYKIVYYIPSNVIYQHLSLITLFILFITTTQFNLNYCLKSKKLVTFLSATLYASFIFLALTYYALVLVSLYSWNRVITAEFIVAYTNQAHFFLEAIGTSIYSASLIMIAIYIVIIIFTYYFIKKFNYLPEHNLPKHRLLATLAFALSLYALYNVNDYFITTHQDSQEPITLTLHSGKPKGVQIHEARLGYKSNEGINLLEDDARKHYQIKSSTRKRNLIIFIVDALRPDHMGVYQYHRNTTPNLNKLAASEDATLFNNVRTVCGETTCAHAGLMASRFVHQLPDNLFTLQEALKLNGYHTNFIISGDHINFHNIREVYGNVDDYYDGSMAKGYYFNDDAITINKTESLPKWNGKPTFIHYHMLSAHQVGKKELEFVKYLPSESYLGKRSGKVEDKYTNFYDNGVLQADSIIDKLLSILKNKKYLEDTLVVITSDHGEALGENNFFMHTNSVVEPVLSIPLIFIQYGKKSDFKPFANNFFSLTDLAPSIMYELDLNIPKSWVGTPVQLEHARQFTFFEMTPYKGLYDHRDHNALWKYWINTNTGEEFVYNLMSDPNENKNLVWSVTNQQKRDWRDATEFKVTP